MHSFCFVQTGLVSGNYDNAGGIRGIPWSVIWTQYFVIIRLIVMGCKWFTYTRLPISVIGMLLFLALELPQKYHTLQTQDFNKSSKIHSKFVAGKLASKSDRIRWSGLINHIHENRVETEVHLIARISSLCVNVQKYATYICAIMQWSLGITSRIATKSQADSSTAL